MVGEAGNADEARELVRDAGRTCCFSTSRCPKCAAPRGRVAAGAAPFVVFATAYERYAMEAFALRCDRLPAEAGEPRQAGATLERIRVRLHHGSDRSARSPGVGAAGRMWPGHCRRLPGFDCAAASLPAARRRRRILRCFALARTIMGAAPRRRLGQGRRRGAGRISGAGARAYGGAHAQAGADRPWPRSDRDVYATTGGARYATGSTPRSKRRADGSWSTPGIRRCCSARTARYAALVHGTGTGTISRRPFAAPTSLGRASLMVAFTDGVIEALDGRDVEFGERDRWRWSTAFGTARGRQLCARSSRVRRHRGARQHQDDVTALVVKGTDDDSRAARGR